MIDQELIPEAAQFRDRRVLITGATGFVGANLARQFVALGAEVHVPLRSESSTWRLDSILDAVTAHRGDLRDRSFVEGVFEEVRPELVYHLAAYGSNQAQSDVHQIMEANIGGTLNLLEASRARPPDLFVYAGTSSEYGPVSGAMDEGAPTNPISHYAISKLAGTHLCTLYARQEGLRTLTLRLFTIYGPWMEPARLIPVVMARGSRGEPVNLTARPITHDFLYVDDAVEAMLRAVSADFSPGEIANLCTGRQHSNAEVVELVGEAMHRNIAVVMGGYLEHSWDIQHWVGSNQHALEVLDWSPRHALPEGLALTWGWMRDHPRKYGITEAP